MENIQGIYIYIYIYLFIYLYMEYMRNIWGIYINIYDIKSSETQKTDPMAAPLGAPLKKAHLCSVFLIISYTLYILYIFHRYSLNIFHIFPMGVSQFIPSSVGLDMTKLWLFMKFRIFRVQTWLFDVMFKCFCMALCRETKKHIALYKDTRVYL